MKMRTRGYVTIIVIAIVMMITVLMKINTTPKACTYSKKLQVIANINNTIYAIDKKGNEWMFFNKENEKLEAGTSVKAVFFTNYTKTIYDDEIMDYIVMND